MAEKAPSVTSSTPSHSWRGWLWDSADVSKEERRFLFKLDATLLTFGTLGMLIKWIDTSNITNAFVSGMKEDLGLYGNQYNYIIVSWTIGYIVGQLPSNFILTRVPAHIWIPFQEIGWTVFTFALAGAKSYRALLGLRFVVGLFEAGYWPALYYVLGSWYNKRMSLQRVRVCLINVTNMFHQANWVNVTVSYSRLYRSRPYSAGSCKLVFTTASMAMLD
jgi:ACS family pantothenate transporter-like MFS transporter